MVLSLIFLPRYKFQGACFSALRGTIVQLARAEKPKSADFCASFRAVNELCADLVKLVLTDTKGLQHQFPLNAPIPHICTVSLRRNGTPVQNMSIFRQTGN